jgi:uncharacterized protein
MPINYFDLTVPVFIKNLTNLKKIIERGFAAATEKGMSEEEFLNQSLAPDMFNLKKQIQIVTDNTKGATARLAEVEIMKIEDTENTVAELLARIDRVITYLKEFKPEQFENAAQAKITLSYMPGQYQIGSDYLVDFALPNFYFHASIIYALIRVQGVAIGKMDFLGGLKLHPVS